MAIAAHPDDIEFLMAGTLRRLAEVGWQTHYVTIANIVMAKASAQALIDRNLAPATFVGIVEDSATMQERFERAYRRAVLMPDLESLAARLYVTTGSFASYQGVAVSAACSYS